MREIVSIMTATLGDAFVVFALFATMMLLGFLLGRLLGGKNMHLADFLVSLAIIVVFSTVVGWRFEGTGIEMLVGLLNIILMLSAYIIGSVFAPVRQKTAPSNDGWGHLPGYDDQGRPRT